MHGNKDSFWGSPRNLGTVFHRYKLEPTAHAEKIFAQYQYVGHVEVRGLLHMDVNGQPYSP